MMNERKPWETPDEPECRDVFAAEMVGDPGPDGKTPLAREIGDWVLKTLERVRARLRKHTGEPAPENPARANVVAGSATVAALSALEGTLQSKSLDGALKEAQILDAYASARQKNADALKLQAEADKLAAEAAKLRQDAAFDRLERIVELMQGVGTPVSVGRFLDGIAITAGEHLIAHLPGVPTGADDSGFVVLGSPESDGAGDGTSSDRAALDDTGSASDV